MFNGLTEFFGPDCNTDVDVITYSGGTVSSISDEIETVLLGKKPTTVAVHCGTNSLEQDDVAQVKETFTLILNNTVWHTGANILLSGVIHRLDRPELNKRADAINCHLKSLDSDKVMFVDHNATFKNLNRMLGK